MNEILQIITLPMEEDKRASRKRHPGVGLRMPLKGLMLNLQTYLTVRPALHILLLATPHPALPLPVLFFSCYAIVGTQRYLLKH